MMDTTTIHKLQAEIIDFIHTFGALVTYEKDYDCLARLRNLITRYEAIINIEAVLLAEKFGIVIGTPVGYETILNNGKYRIFHVLDFSEFAREFNTFVQEKLAN